MSRFPKLLNWHLATPRYNKVFLNDGTTLLNDGYYGIAATGSTASAMIRVIAGFVASGYPLQCEELDQIYE